MLVRHAQASFGAADYDVLSPLGHRQSEALGRTLAEQGFEAGAVFTGGQRRHRETWEGVAKGLGTDARPVVHPGLDEFDAAGLLAASGIAPGRSADRTAHFKALREAVLAWQRDEIADPPEAWAAFEGRVSDARDALVGAAPSLAVSSGGAISLMVALTLGAPPDRAIELQLQMVNCAVTRLVATRRGVTLHSFNEAPRAHADADLVTYS